MDVSEMRQEVSMGRRTATAAALCAAVVLGALCVSAQTADEILDEIEDLFSIGADDAGGILATMVLHNDYPGDVSSDYSLAVFGLTDVDSTKPEDADETTYLLMLFLGGDEHGSILLLKTPEDETLDSQMWFYLPALGMTKEIVSDEDQSRSFAGSSMSYGDLGSTGDLRDDYDATILREDTMGVADETFDVWVLELLAKPDADADYGRILLWVSKGDYLTLRMESYGDSDVLEDTMEFRALGEFEGDRLPEVIYSVDLKDETSTTVTISDTRRPDAPLSLDFFDPASFGELNPSVYGF
jgi:hypothetical protein